MRTAVVLPAPFGPSTPRTVPRSAYKSVPASAFVLPKFLIRPSALIASATCVTLPLARDTQTGSQDISLLRAVSNGFRVEVGSAAKGSAAAGRSAARVRRHGAEQEHEGTGNMRIS